MILITLGTQEFAMNRLIDQIDYLIEKGALDSDKVVIQHGASKKSMYGENHSFFTEKEFDSLMFSASLVICHGGTSSIIKALQLGKKVIVVPRLSKFNEHVDDHQLEIVEIFSDLNYLDVIYEVKDLEKKMSEIHKKNFKIFKKDGLLAKIIVSSL